MATLSQSVTDRAHRYRAVKNMPAGEKRCAFCGENAGLIEAGHVDGHEEHDEPENLIWTCRPCNVIAGNTLRAAGAGRLTRQYNPKKVAGATTLGEWMQAVGAITPRVDRGDRGLASDMPVLEAVAIIRATPASRRSRFAAELRKHGSRNPTRQNLWPFSKTKAARSGKRSSMTIGTASSAAYKAGQKSGDTGLFDSWVSSQGLDSRGDALLNRLRQFYEKGVNAGENQTRTATPAAKMSETTRRTIFRDVAFKGYRISPSGQGFKTSPGDGTEFDTVNDAKRFISDEVKMRRNPRTRKNSAEASDRMYKKFHGREPDGAVIVEDEEHVHENLAVLGLLMEIRVDTVTGMCATLSFEDDPPFLCSAEDGNQLYIEAGDQTLDLKALGFDDKKWIKDRMVIGRFSPPEGKTKWNIGYQTEKDFDKFETILYQHDLGEETSLNGKKNRIPEEDRVRPMLEYEPKNQKLFITGGQYTIKLPLIGTSPGIEN